MEMMDMAADDIREELRRKLRSNFDGRIVRKDLTKKIKERLRLFHGSGDSGVHCKMYAPCKTDGTCCDISQTSKLSAVKIDIVEYGR